MNKYIFKDDYIEIIIRNSDSPYLIDYKDLAFAKNSHWFSIYGDYNYLATKLKGKLIRFHIEIMKDEILKFFEDNNYSKRVIVDHKDGNIRNNRRSNLRVRTQSENNMNKDIQSNNTSGIVGVSWHTRDRVWCAYITMNSKRVNLGRYYYLRNAVKARINAEDKYFGEHAFRNRDNNEYNIIINYILSLPNIKEPIFRKKRGMYDVNGVRKSRKRFEARINGEWARFDKLKDAIQWRIDKEIEIHGQKITFNCDKLDMQI